MEQKAKMRLVTPQRTPRIRFPEFSRNWEKKKLGEVLIDLYNGQTPSRSRLDFWNGNINWLSSGELNRGVICKTAEKITKAGQQDAHLRIIPAGTFVIAITGLEAAGTRGNCAILGLDTTVNQSCMALFPDDKKLNVKFLFKWYEKVGERYGIIYTQGTKQQSYNANIIKKMEIFLPSLPEQEKIADFFTAIDEKIDAKEKEIEEVKTLKKGFLQQLFPQEGETVPRLRFPGFSGVWEKKKMGEIVQRKSKKGISDFQTPSVEYEDINAKEGTLNKNIYNKMTGKEGILFDKDDIVYGKLRPYLGNWINPTFTGVAVGDFWVLKPKAKLAKGFVYYLIQGTKFQKIANQSTGTKMPRADWKLIANTIFAVPSLPEQEKIADFFSALDEKIEAMEKQRDALKAMKKGFLQQMFI